MEEGGPLGGVPAADGTAVEAFRGRPRPGGPEAAARDALCAGEASDGAALRRALAVGAAYEHGLRALARRDRTRAELERSLARYGADAAAAALERLAPYLDDRRFADAWVRTRQAARPAGAPVLVEGLVGRGVPRPVAEAAVAAYWAEVGPGAEESLCRQAAQAWRAGRGARGAAPAALYTHLVRRGFDPEVAERVAREVAGGPRG
jgi:SOS response regulatory protein OraA/RecX